MREDDWEDFFVIEQHIDDDNKLVQTTHMCPRTGDYCLPTCAYAAVPRVGEENEQKTWVCGKVVKMLKGQYDFWPQGVTWVS